MSFENELGKLVECLALLNMLPEALDVSFSIVYIYIFFLFFSFIFFGVNS